MGQGDLTIYKGNEQRAAFLVCIIESSTVKSGCGKNLKNQLR